MKWFLGWPVLLILLFVAAPAAAAPSADDIAKRLLDSSAFDWTGAKTRMKMVLISKDGKKRVRVMEILARRKNGLVQTVVRFQSPPDVAGTAFLMLERKGGKAEQHIYLPGLRRTRRISGREREGSFVGSDFAIGDLRRGDARKAKHEKLPDDKIGDAETYVIRSVPKKKRAAYSKVETWVRKKDFVPMRTRFYDRKGKLLKTLYARKVKKLDGRAVVVAARMENHQTGHATELLVEKVERRDDLPDTAFTPNALEHQ